MVKKLSNKNVKVFVHFDDEELSIKEKRFIQVEFFMLLHEIKADVN